jgi:hypothetical protein
MPRTEHPVDVWYNYETGQTLDRARDRTKPHHIPFEDPPIEEIRQRQWYAFRYGDSQCEKTEGVPEDARFIIPHHHGNNNNATGTADSMIEWYDKSTFTPEEQQRATFYPVYPLKTTERQHELEPKHLFPPHRNWHPPAIPEWPAVFDGASFQELLHFILRRADEIDEIVKENIREGTISSAMVGNALFISIRGLLDSIPVQMSHLFPHTIRFLTTAVSPRNARNVEWRVRFGKRIADSLREDIALQTLVPIHSSGEGATYPPKPSAQLQGW